MRYFLSLIAICFVFSSERTEAQVSSPEISQMLEDVSAEEIEKTMRALSGFESRCHLHPDAIKAQEWLKSHWEEIVQGRSDIQVEYFHHPEISPMPSLILTINGHSIPEDIIVAGGHIDSAAKEVMGAPPTDEECRNKKAPGANDNASGIAVITEVLRVVVEHDYRPEKTVMLMAYAAEEIGLKGSEHIANTFAEEGRNVVGVLNLDMTNSRNSQDLDLVIINDADYTSSGLNASLVELIGIYLPEINWEYGQCGRGCSDHASWTNAGFPAAFVFESRFSDLYPHIHKATDTFEASGGNAEHSTTFAKLALAFVAEQR